MTDELLTVLRQDGYENFRVLIGIDDSSAEDSVQKNEIAYFRQNLREETRSYPAWTTWDSRR